MNTPSLTWKNNLPFSQKFEDIYFSHHGALEESHHVFINGNHIQERFQKATNFIIGELGFGTGLNFAVTCQEWESHSSSKANLEYIAIEKFPLKKSDLEKISSHWPKLKKYFSHLIKNYPLRISGFHHIQFSKNIQLTLIYADVLEALKGLNTEVDAWYLDGFAPPRNPEMWSEDVFKQVAQLTKAKGTFATYSAAGQVRRNLEASGFKLKKEKGFAKKREMLIGTLINKNENHRIKPWFDYPKLDFKKIEKKAVIIGGGLAGCWTAHALVNRGWKIDLIEQHESLAQEASGNRASILYPYIGLNWDKYHEFYTAGFAHSLRKFRQLKKDCSDFSWNECGLVQLAKNKDEKERFQKISKLSQLSEDYIQYLDKDSVSQVSGIDLKNAGLFFPHAGWLDPRQLCQLLIQSPLIKIHLNQKVDQIKKQEQNWQLLDGKGKSITESPIIILANAHAAENFLQIQDIPFNRVRGQITYLDEVNLDIQTQTILCGDKSFFALDQNHFDIGASFEPEETRSELLESSQQKNLTFLNKIFPKESISIPKKIKGRVAFRTTSEDRLPVVGPLFDTDIYKRDYAELHHGRPWDNYPKASYLPGMYLNLAHGSRGLTSCGLSAEWLAGYLNGESSFLNQSLVEALHPARFLIKKMKKAL